MPWQPAAIQSNRGTKLIEILRLSHKGNREIKSNVCPLARITNKLNVRWFGCSTKIVPASVKSTFDSRLLSTRTGYLLRSKIQSRASIGRGGIVFQNEDHRYRHLVRVFSQHNEKQYANCNCQIFFAKEQNP